MAIVQPSSGNVVQPTFDFELLDGGRRLVYHAKTQNKGRMVIAVIAMIPLLLIAVFGFFFGLAGLSESSTSGGGTALMLVAVACGFAVFGLVRWSNGAKRRSITFDDKSISFDGRTYLLEHVTSIGWRASSGYSAGGSGWQGTAMMTAAQMGYALSGQVYMQYGADEVIIIGNLHPNNTQTVHGRIVGFLEQFGHKYGS